MVRVLLELGQAWNDFDFCVSVIFSSFSPSEFESSFLSPLRGWLISPTTTHSLRPFDKLRAGCGLHSSAALQLDCKWAFVVTGRSHQPDSI